MAGFDPAIHVFVFCQSPSQVVDARDKRGHDNFINLTSV
jgi:hypothetical protein